MLTRIAALAALAGTLMAADAPPPATIPELEEQIKQVLQKRHTPAAAVSIVNRDRVLWTAGIGTADLASGRAATADTLFRIGSITKGFVALSVVMLVEEGRLSLDDPVRRHAPDVAFDNRWESTDPVRIVHLLEHTTGWDDLALREFAHNDPNPISLRDGFAYHPVSRTSRWRPGDGVSYCNSGPPVAAYVVEKVTGMRFEDFVSKRIFEPLGMETASFFPKPELAPGYRPGSQQPVKYWNILQRPAGTINASARDMAEYIRLHLNRGKAGSGVLLQPASMDRIERPASSLGARHGVGFGYGLCNMTMNREGFMFHGHGGGMDGFLADMEYLPGAGIGYIVMINAGSPAALNEIGELVRAHITRDLPKPVFPAPVGSPRDQIAGWAGYYEPRNPRMQIVAMVDRLTRLSRIRLDGDALVVSRMSGGRARKLLPAGGDRFRPEDAPVSDRVFLRGENGETLMVVQGSVFRRIPAWAVRLELAAAALSLALMASAVLFALWWIPRRLMRKGPRPLHLGARLWPLVAAVTLALLLLLMAGDDPSMIWLLGEFTPYSAAVFLLSVLFPLAAIAGLFAAWRARRRGMAALPSAHSLAVSLAGCAIAAYFAYWGLLGIRTWQ